MLPTIALSDFMKAIKASSSKIIKTKNGFEQFKAWGKGYAALSFNLRDKDVIGIDKCRPCGTILGTQLVCSVG
jgi:hypothetical protein